MPVDPRTRKPETFDRAKIVSPIPRKLAEEKAIEQQWKSNAFLYDAEKQKHFASPDRIADGAQAGLRAEFLNPKGASLPQGEELLKRQYLNTDKGYTLVDPGIDEINEATRKDLLNDAISVQVDDKMKFQLDIKPPTGKPVGEGYKEVVHIPYVKEAKVPIDYNYAKKNNRDVMVKVKKVVGYDACRYHDVTETEIIEKEIEVEEEQWIRNVVKVKKIVKVPYTYTTKVPEPYTEYREEDTYRKFNIEEEVLGHGKYDQVNKEVWYKQVEVMTKPEYEYQLVPKDPKLYKPEIYEQTVGADKKLGVVQANVRQEGKKTIAPTPTPPPSAPGKAAPKSWSEAMARK